MATEISPKQALTAVGNWLRYTGQQPLETPLTRENQSVQSIHDEHNQAVGHVVALQDGGFVVTGADDGVTPIIAFAAKGHFPTDPRHPLRILLGRDLPQRMATAERHRASPATRQDPALPDYPAQWQELLSPPKKTRNGVEYLDDVRVPPLVQSTWGQSAIFSDDWERISVYNYYTPNNYVTGCTATAGAQLLRFHAYPAKTVEPRIVKCHVDGEPVELSMFGGTYDWQNMPLKPDGDISLTQRKAIGKLLHDVAVSIGASFTANATSASCYWLYKRLVDTFHFASAKQLYCLPSITDTPYLEDTLLTNLDAGYPTIISLDCDTSNGHAVVGDGYGFLNRNLYVHLNMGWDGYSDSWYNLPNVGTDYYIYNTFDSLVFHAFPDFVGELISGRVSDAQGRPLPGIAVTAQDAVSLSVVAETTTNERGIYALKIPEPGDSPRSYYVGAIFPGFGGGHNKINDIVTSANDNHCNENYNSVSIGSRWGVDFQLEPLSFLYEIEDGAVRITGFLGEPQALNIPETIEGLPVVAIGAGAFAHCGTLASITIPDSVTSIGAEAFAHCDKLISITIPDSVTSIGAEAFAYCDKLISITIPDSVALIGAEAFAYCANLRKVLIGAGVTEMMHSSFAFCAGIEEYIVSPDNLAYSSEDGVLFNKNMTVLLLYPSGRIGAYQVLDGVERIDADAFSGCDGLTQINIPGSVAEIGEKAFANCASLISAMIHDGVGIIGDYVFTGCDSLHSVSLPDSLTAIPYRAFADCSNLSRIRLGKNLASIDDEAFNSCSSLRQIFLPASLQTLGCDVFSSCNALQHLYFLGEPPACKWENIPEQATVFYLEGTQGWENLEQEDFAGHNVVMLTTASSENFAYVIQQGEVTITGYNGTESEFERYFVYVPPMIEDCPVVAIGDSAFAERLSGEHKTFFVILPESIRQIGKSAFANCDAMLECVLPDHLLAIGEDAFAECCTQVTIPTDVFLIGNRALAGCAIIVAEPENVDYSSINGVLFSRDRTVLIRYPNGLQEKSYTVPEGVLHIGTEAFTGAGLQKVVLPDSLVRIGKRAFANSALTDIEFGKGLRSIGDLAFCKCGHLTSMTIPDSVVNLGYGAFHDCQNLQTVSLGAGITSLYSHVFAGCDLQTITIPHSVARISAYAFVDCPLSSIVLEGSPQIDSFAFYWSTARTRRNFHGVFCLAEPPQSETLSFSPENKIYYRDGTPGWEGVGYLYGIEVVKLPADFVIPSIGSNSQIYISGESGQSFSCCINDHKDTWRWTAPKDGTVLFDTSPGRDNWNYDLSLCAHTFKLVENSFIYEEMEERDDVHLNVIFDVEAGLEYLIQVLRTRTNRNFSALSWCYVDCFEDFVVSIKNGQATIVEYRGAAEEVNIPEQINGSPVVAIGTAAFANNSTLTKVSLPSTLVCIGEWAFSGCENLTAIPLPEGLAQIGAYAFRDAGLETVSIPDSVHYVGQRAFEGCSSLQSVHLGAALRRIEAWTFAECKSLRSIRIPNNIQFISICAFVESSASTVVLEGTPTIEEVAFSYDGTLQAIYCCGEPPFLAPDSILPECTIYYWTGTPGWEGLCELGGQPTAMLAIDSEIPEQLGSHDDFANAWLIQGEWGLVHDNNQGCTREENEPQPLRRYTLWWRWIAPKDGRVLFDTFGCDLDTTLGVYTGETLNSLNNVVFNDDAFNGRQSNVEFTATANTEYRIAVGSWSYEGEVRLSWSYLGDGEDYVIDVVDGGATIIRFHGSAAEITIPAEIDGFPVVAIGERAFSYRAKLTNVVLPDGLISIGREAFTGTSLHSITIPDSVTSIGTGAFRGCKDMRAIHFGRGVTMIHPQTFAGCISLNELFIPANINYIGTGAFADCDGLKGITLEGTVRIARRAFCDDAASWNDASGDSFSVYCRSVPPVLEILSLPPGATLHYDADQPGWDSIEFLNGYSVRNAQTVVNTVVFVVGDKGSRIGGGELRQEVRYCQAAQAPEIADTSLLWRFHGWGQDFVRVTAPLIVFAQYEETGFSAHKYKLSAGWNLISITLDLEESSHRQLMNRSMLTLDQITMAYIIPSEIRSNQAYWLYCANDETLTVYGTPHEEENFTPGLLPGWNLIGTDDDLNLADSGLVAWGWNGQFFYPTERLSAGQGYYVYGPDAPAP